ncbi:MULTISPECIES: hypothetical protein [unclassified Streptomyces]|uniref:hypothetical protein n=1 Tax=unclassified Streptomyces TaxID=2593676 RepID=UPI002E8187CA|nr:hypothetical protein [Streptomyces sp. NBC_00589]WTI37494.1 hypothetical protein OIC96_21985 [Streptomyces sp. NBC_00775]WUB28828.1 hypothetical protein OHA51_27750 [Streptomyces sp. NBC_00589]
MTTAASPLHELRADIDTWAEPIEPREALVAAESMMQRLAAEHAAALDAAYRERNHLAAWLAALHLSFLAPAETGTPPPRITCGPHPHDIADAFRFPVVSGILKLCRSLPGSVLRCDLAKRDDYGEHATIFRSSISSDPGG